MYYLHFGKKTSDQTTRSFPAAVASQASKSSDLHTAEIIWFSKSKQKQKRLQLNKKTTRPITCLTDRVLNTLPL